jgi:hypothetical protein
MVRKKTGPVAADAEPLLEKGATRKRFSSADDVDHATKRQRPELEDRTDFSRWRMRDDHGRQTWQYLEDAEAAENWPQTIADKYFLGLPLVSVFAACMHLSVRALVADSTRLLSPPGPPRPPQTQETPRVGPQRPRIL